jgi:hypothetical protein
LLNHSSTEGNLGCFWVLSIINKVARNSNALREYKHIKSTWAATTKHHRLDDLNNRNVLSHSSGSGSLRSGCQHSQVPLGTLFLTCIQLTCLLCPSMAEKDRQTWKEKGQEAEGTREQILWCLFLQG